MNKELIFDLFLGHFRAIKAAAVLPCYSWVDAIFLLKQLDGDWQSSRGRGRAESCGESVGHVCDEPEWHGASADSKDDGQDYEAVQAQANQDSGEVQTQLASNHVEVSHLQDLATDEEEHAHWGEVDDPGGDGHHGLGKAGEEIDQGLSLLLHDGQSDAQYHREEDKTEDVGPVSVLASNLPCVQVGRYSQLSSIRYVFLARVLEHCSVLLDASLKLQF